MAPLTSLLSPQSAGIEISLKRFTYNQFPGRRQGRIGRHKECLKHDSAHYLCLAFTLVLLPVLSYFAGIWGQPQKHVEHCELWAALQCVGLLSFGK